MLKLRDIMSHDVLTVSPDITLRDAMELLADRHVSGAPVMAGGRVIGVISLTDLVAFAASTPGVPTERAQTIDLAESEGGEAAANEWVEGDEPPASFFVEHWADAGADVAERIAETAGPEWNVLEEHTVAEAMTRVIRSLSPDTPVDQAAEVMRTSSVHRVLVMRQDELLGLVTTKDIADAVADHMIAARTYVFDPKSEFDDRGWP